MKVITSRDNATYKNAQKLLRKKFRDETGRYLLEGIKPLQDAAARGIRIEKIFVCEGVEADIHGLPAERMVRVSRELFAGISDTATSQGVIAVTHKEPMSLEGFLQRAGGHIVVLDRLQDPGNAGTIIRTAEAAGFTGILCIRGAADLYAPKVVRAAAGSLFRMKVVQDVPERDAIEALRGSRQIIVSALDAACDCFHMPPAAQAALVIGNEGSGVSPGFMQAADLKVTIPMEGQIESLNAAVAAGILMYQIYLK